MCFGIQDIEANDLPREHLPERGFPLLKLFPGKQKATPLSVPMLEEGHKGIPTVVQLLDFVAAHSSTRFVVTDAMRAQAEAMEVCTYSAFVHNPLAFESRPCAGVVRVD